MNTLLAAAATRWIDLGYDVGLIILGISIGGVAEWFRNRSKLIHDVAERYIEDRRAALDHDEPCNRLGSMQRAGIGMFKNDKQIMKFCTIVVGRGITHPFLNSDLDKFLKKNGLPMFLREASRRGVSLSNDMALYEMLIEGFEQAEVHKQ